MDSSRSPAGDINAPPPGTSVPADAPAPDAAAPPLAPSPAVTSYPRGIARSIDRDEFFERHHARLSRWLDDFARVNRRARRSSGAARAAAVAELAGVASHIVAESLEVVHAGPAVVHDGTADECVSLLERLADAMRGSTERDFIRAVDGLDEHVGYFRRTFPAAPAAGDPRHEDFVAAVRECLDHSVHIITRDVLIRDKWYCADPREATRFFDVQAAEAALTPAARATMEDVLKLDGWCSPQKAILLYHLVREYRPRRVVEIGIYGGRSIVPIAAALRDNGDGEVWGVEAWSGEGATSHRTNLDNDFYWMNVDFKRIKGDFLRFVLDHELHDRIRVVESPAERCGPLFDTIDFLHIDGNHSVYAAAQDVVIYASKVPPGGIIVYDDINWSSTGPGLEILRDTCRLLHVVTTFDSDTVPGCAAFMKV